MTEDSIDAIDHTPNASNDIELGNFNHPKPTSEIDAPPSYSQATRVPTPPPTLLRSFTPRSRLDQPSPRRATTWYGELIPVLAVVVFFTAAMGIAQSVSYGVYYSNYHYLLPPQDLLVPIVGGGPFQLFLAALAFVCYKIKGRIMLAICASLLFIGILAGLVIPATSLALNLRSSSDTQSIVSRLMAAPQVVMTYADQFQSCTYNIPANDTINTPLDIVPQYLDQTCRYKAIVCSVPINTCYYNYNRAYACVDNSQTQSVQGPCNTLARTAYQVDYDWNKVEKMVDGWAMGVWGFWFAVFLIFSLRYYGGRV